MTYENGESVDIKLTVEGEKPFSNCELIEFETSKFPEAMLYINRDGGILITCDSIKNWVAADKYFSQASADMSAKQGFFGEASISPIWLNVCEVKPSDFAKLNDLSFKHLLSAHGKPLLDNADVRVKQSIANLD